MAIPVIVIDDEQVDRYTVKRRLARHGGFDEVLEARSGDAFLIDYCDRIPPIEFDSAPVLILIDINMPGRNGFETVEELQRRQDEGRAPPSVVVMMFTSSSNPNDKQRAKALPLVNGYIEKPIDAAGVEQVFDLYRSHVTGKAA
ncbi:hypothetical protein CVM52_16890 [Pseudooceanicola lipolyticus]|uniref:Response regulatory domain-containing protein n=1 Tax=Pseudooceanicola lipolyticus TaxID=2029104 RepID=A0A2M8IYA0_9RHOB|nr:response regulator [Pseudooceanicola lipolyticus]PJE35492.1 hypothetical protein CVM52_16890 [Pseudooceanicola lipolyticus]